jgi:HprK-related kinase A
LKHSHHVQVGPVGFRIGSTWAEPIRQLKTLYADYPAPTEDITEHLVRLEPTSPMRRWVKPSIAIAGGYTLPEAAPLPLSMGLIAAEMAMNLQVALGERHYLLLHAATVARDGKAIILTGESGSGKSTLSALLMTEGWRFMGDEFALLGPETGLLHPFPRPVSLKNQAMAVMGARLPESRFGPVMKDTPKGDIRHLIPDVASIKAMHEPARPIAILFPTFGEEMAVRPMGQGEVFVRLTQASTNYTALGERGFHALAGLVKSTPAIAIDYPDTAGGLSLVEQVWAERG